MADLRKRAVLLASGSLISTCFGLAVAAVLSRILDKPVYGTYQQAFLVYSLLLGVMSLNLGASLLYFLPRLQDQQRKAIVGQSVVIGMIVGLAIGAVMFLGSPWIAEWLGNDSVVPLLYCVAIYAVFNQITNMAPNGLIAMDRADLVFWYTVGCAVGRATVIVLPFLLGFDIQTVFFFIIGWEFVAAGLGLLLLRLSTGISFRAITWHGLWKEFDYMWPLLAASILGTLSVQFDKAVVAVAFDPARFAEYANGAMQLPLVFIVLGSINTAVLPEMSRHAGLGQIDAMLGLWRQAAIKGAAVIFPMVFFCIMCPDYLMVLLYGDKYLASALPFLIYCIGLTFRVVVYGSVFQALGRNRVQIGGAIVALVVGITTTLLLIYLGQGTQLAFAGPAIGTIAATFGAAVYLTWQISRLAHCPISRALPFAALGKLAMLALGSAALAAAVRLVPLAPLFKVILMASVFSAAYMLVGLRFSLISSRDVQFLTGPLTRAAAKVFGAKS